MMAAIHGSVTNSFRYLPAAVHSGSLAIPSNGGCQDFAVGAQVSLFFGQSLKVNLDSFVYIRNHRLQLETRRLVRFQFWA
jgi:hypothetical protein